MADSTIKKASLIGLPGEIKDLIIEKFDGDFVFSDAPAIINFPTAFDDEDTAEDIACRLKPYCYDNPIFQILRRVHPTYRARIPFSCKTGGFDRTISWRDILDKVEHRYPTLLACHHLPCYHCRNVRHGNMCDDGELGRLPDGDPQCVIERKCIDCKLDLQPGLRYDWEDSTKGMRELVKFQVGGVLHALCPLRRKLAFHPDLPPLREGLCHTLNKHLHEWRRKKVWELSDPQRDLARESLALEQIWEGALCEHVDWNRMYWVKPAPF